LNWQITLPYLVMFLLVGLFALAMSLVIGLKFRAPGRIALVVALVACGFWCWLYGVEVGELTLAAKRFAGYLAMIPVVVIPSAWFIFCMQYARVSRILTPPVWGGLALVPITTLLLAATDTYHGLIYPSMEMVLENGYSLLKVEAGPWMLFNSAYSFLLLTSGSVLVMVYLMQTVTQYNLRLVATMASALLPALIGSLAMLPTGVFPTIDLGSMATTLSFTLVGWQLAHYAVPNLVTYARALVIEKMGDGVLVLDQNFKIVDVNAEGKRLLDSGIPGPIVGQMAKDILPGWSEFSSQLEFRPFLAVETRVHDLSVELKISRLVEGYIFSGWLVLMHDITRRLSIEQTRQEALALAQHRLREVETLWEIAGSLNQITSLKEALQSSLNSVASLLRVDLGWIVTIENGSLVLAASYQLPEGMPEFQALKCPDCVPKVLARSGRAPGMIQIEECWWLMQAVSSEMKGFAGFPISINNNLAGYLNLVRRPDNAFSEDEIRLISTVATQMSSVIERDQLMTAEREERVLADTLREVGARLSGTLDLDRVLDLMIELVTRLVPFDMANIMMVEDGHVRMVRSRGFVELESIYQDLKHRRLKMDDFQTFSWMQKNRRAMVIQDTYNSPHWIRGATVSLIRSWLGAPIFSHDRCIAFICLDNQTPGFYQPYHLQRLEAFAEAASLALENARLYIDIVDSLAREQRLNDVIHIMNRSSDLEVLMPVLLERTMSLLDAQAGILGLFLAEKEKFTHIYAQNLHQGNEDFLKNSGEKISWHLMYSGKSLYLPDLAEVDQPARRWQDDVREWAQAGFNGFIGVPLLSSNSEPLGFFGLFSTGDKRFAMRDMMLLEAVGQQAGLVIQNMRLLEAERWRAQTLEALGQINIDITSNLDLSSLLRSLLRRAMDLMHVDVGELGLVAEGGVKVEACYNLAHDYEGTLMKMGEGAMGMVAQTCKPLIISDYAVWENRSSQYKNAGVHACLVAPLMIGQELLGVVLVGASNPEHQFTQEDASLLALFAQQGAVALHNARLFQAAEQRAREAETLRRAAAAITSTLDEDEVLNLILEQLERVVPYDSASVQILEGNDSVIVAGRGFDTLYDVVGIRFDGVNDGINSLVYKTGKPIIIENPQQQFADFSRLPGWQVTCWMGVPLIFKNKIIGMLTLDGNKPQSFTPSQFPVVTAFADQVATALQNMRLFSQVERQAITDPLTGLYNRRYFSTMAHIEIERSVRYGHALSIMMYDIDHFKQVNDTYGHDVGDEVLKELANRSHACLRQLDLLCRYGGEEFIALLPETTSHEAYEVAERLRRSVQDHPFSTSIGPLSITISLGVAGLDQASEASLDGLVKHADQAMYLAKDSGRNRSAIWTFSHG